MIKASIIGATGYSGMELVRLLYTHPKVSIYKLVSKTYKDKHFSNIYPNFKNILDIKCSQMDIQDIGINSDVIFTCLPHGISQQVIKKLYKYNKVIIDLSGDFRYDNGNLYKEWYGIKHECPDILANAVYGLPELYRNKIKKACLIGNPGCYPTSSILGIAPLALNKLIDNKNIIIDSKSGATGAGRSVSQAMHFCECDENFKAYKVASHRHTSEIEQEISKMLNIDTVLSFTPHLLPIKRGILTTIYCNLMEDMSSQQIINLYRDFFQKEPFVRIYENDSFPELKNVVYSNFCDIGIKVDDRTNKVIIISTIDNLVKGAAGQAVQNMNIIFGFEETCGLKLPAAYI
ncbi:MAG: N-acetyl-gamma-glutamyl-phosphate reductase [Clostridia bacterium]|nr:N-acetyl-gamma-glutamyl-phosphate reductase [Clostridia bacterium]